MMTTTTMIIINDDAVDDKNDGKGIMQGNKNINVLQTSVNTRP